MAPLDNRAPLSDAPATVIGGGLAGCEAAWQIAQRRLPVTLVEMRPAVASPAHHSDSLGELVCSNSLKGTDPDSAAGQLKRELKSLGSIILAVAENTRVPAGGALAVDRTAFARELTSRIEAHPFISVQRGEATTIPASDRVIIATGPLTSPGLQTALSDIVGASRLAFFDAAAPIIEADSIDRGVCFAASRYDKGGSSDYLNCPLDESAYLDLVAELRAAGRVVAKDFESGDLFRACQPVEEIARTGVDALRYGALKPVGLTDPATGTRPWAVVQLRPENAACTAYNLVGFQTNLTFPEQQRVFRMIPGLSGARFLRYGVMHRNTFVDAPRVLDATLAVRAHPRVRIAGQLSGTEGYLEAAGTGLLAGLNAGADSRGLAPFVMPPVTALGSLVAYATNPATDPYQPMHVNWGLVPPLDPAVRGRRARYAAYAQRALDAALETVWSHPLYADSGDANG